MLKINVLSILTFLCLNLLSQGNSPYSELGIGGITQSTFQSNFSTGGLSTTYDSRYFINPENPASYGKIKYTVGEAGLYYSNNYYSDSTGTGTNSSFNIGHFGFAFPILSNMGVALGIMPYSKTDYNYSFNDVNQDNLSIKRKFKGKGNLSQLFLGTGFSINNFSFGVNGKYIFGELTKAEHLEFLSGDFTNIRNQEITLVRGLTAQAGAIYEIPVGEKHTLKLGGTFNLGNNIAANKYQVINNYSSSTATVDNEVVVIENHTEGTVLLNTESDPTKQDITLPHEYKAGISFSKKGRYYLGLDYKNSAWDVFKIGGISQGMARQQNLILGGEYIPNKDAKGIENYFKSVIYRAGINYGNSSIVTNGEQLTEYGIKFGLGFPLKKYKYESEKFGSYLFTSIGYDRISAENPGSISEHYFKINFSVILNDKWFVKRKFD
ncbi:MAG: hypothetical protein ACJA0Q_001127 [Saprospiraceae bacterium]|jgi:hypothetical protein